MSDIPVVELSGSREAMGQAFGEQFREKIRTFADSRIRHAAEFVVRYDLARKASRMEVLQAAEATIDAHRNYDPAIWAEFEGIARGADISLSELIACNGYTDVRDLALMSRRAGRPTPSAAHDGECSALLAPPEAAGGSPMVAQTWDMNADAAEYIIAVRRKPDDAPETLGFTTVGCLCLIGINSEGVSVGNTNLVPNDPRPGVNYLFTITRALAQRSADAAADAVEATPRLSGHNFYMADAKSVINVETTAHRSVRTKITGRAFVHTNHYMADELRPLQYSGQILTNTCWRCDKLSELVASHEGSVDLDTAWELLARVTQDKAPQVGPDNILSATIGTIAQRPAEGTIRMCTGGPKPGEYIELKV